MLYQIKVLASIFRQSLYIQLLCFFVTFLWVNPLSVTLLKDCLLNLIFKYTLAYLVTSIVWGEQIGLK